MPTKDHDRAEEKKNLESLRRFRNEDTQNKEDVLSSFMFWLEYDYEKDVPKEKMEELQNLISLFLGYDMEKVKQGELALLKKWNKSVRGE